ncbi:MAG TPA: DNA polymerase III subunit delta [Hyphomicrobiaceae bacterium]|nr:DNA polymerase III subunit delta [Hyphomicrobiaceae bacterium]
MVAIKSHQANAFLAAVERVPPAVLLYGSDVGLVSERAALLARRLAGRDDPPGEIIRLDDAVLEEDPDRVFVELQTLPMFGGRKVVRATAGRRITAALLAPLVESAGLEASLIVEAGNLRPDDALRGLFEKARGAAAVACYPDEARDLEGVVREVLAAAKLDIAPEAKRLLLARLGADRALSRAEIEKLALYAHGKRVVDEADVEAAVGDAAELALDRIVLAAAAGEAAALAELDRSLSAGESAQAVIAALQRHFLRLHRMRSALDAGRPMDDIVRAQRPPLHFKQRDAIEQQCRAWPVARLGSALAHIAEAAKAARLNPALEATLAERLLLDLQALAKGR